MTPGEGIDPFLRAKVNQICETVGVPPIEFDMKRMRERIREPVAIVNGVKNLRSLQMKGVVVVFDGHGGMYGHYRRRRIVANPTNRTKKRRVFHFATIQFGERKDQVDGVYFRNIPFMFNGRTAIVSHHPKDALSLVVPIYMAICSQDWSDSCKESKACFVLLKLIESMLGSHRMRKQKLTDIIGYDSLKDEFLKIVDVRLDVRKVSKLGLGNRNILLVGNAGCGKSMLMRALANYVESKGALVVNFSGVMDIEAWLPIVSALTRQLDVPLFVCIDEIDEIGVARDIERTRVYEFLRMMDGLTDLSNVTFCATSNRPQMLDAALLRPERFYPVYMVGLPDAKTRYQLFEHYFKRYGIANGQERLTALVELTKSWTGADIRGVVEDLIYLSGGNAAAVSYTDLLERVKKLSGEKVKRNAAWQHIYDAWLQDLDVDVSCR